MNTSLRHSALLALAALVPALAGCLSLKDPYPNQRQYVIDLARPQTKAAQSLGGVLKVRTFRVSTPFDGAQLVYRTTGVTYQTDFYNIFLARPGDLVTDSVRTWLSASGVFPSVVHDSSRIQAAYLLEANVLRLYGDYRDKSAPVAVLEIEFFILRQSGGAAEVIFHKTYASAVPLPSRAPSDLVKGFGKSLEDILSAFAVELEKALPPLPRAGPG